ncbi:MAG: hypothetical protein DRN61_06320 [Thaumarchaeota archaeon]|nr:MAG: hypothetical protein DRN61_06320 [Nitrososphaerota archaeon]
MAGSEDPRLVELLEICKVVIERDFAPCGLREEVIERVKELFAEWKRKREKAAREGRTIGGVKVIFYDLLRLVEMARANSERHGKPFCEYLSRALKKSYHEKGGLGYYSIKMWK